MADDLAPSPPEPRLRGNSREYLYARLVRGGFHELLRAVDAGTLTVYAAAADAGLVKRPEPLGTGSPNARKRINWAIHQAYRGSARANGATKAEGRHPVGASEQRDELAPHAMPDLAAALAEVAEMRRTGKREVLAEIGRIGKREVRDLAAEEGANLSDAEHDRLLSIIERLEGRLHDHPLAHPAVACTTCSSPCAPAAVRELFDVALAARRGETGLDGSSIPKACCKRQLRVVDVRALVG